MSERALMPYDLQLAQINTNFGGLNITHLGALGFPENTNFDTLLMSYWMCGPHDPARASPKIWPMFGSAHIFDFAADNSVPLTGGGLCGIALRRTVGSAAPPFFTADIPPPLPTTPPGCLLHFLMSVDTSTQTVQVYINDKPITLIDPTWIGSPPFHFNNGPFMDSSIWSWDVKSATTTWHPALGDAWITNPPGFVDLSVTANRRKFISNMLTPVDLGDAGTLAFGYQPHIYMSIRSGGVPSDILTNLGDGGEVWTIESGSTGPPSEQTDGICLAIPVPPPEPASLALDDVVVTDETQDYVRDSQIYLLWSDDRGHSYGSPVGQPIGAPGAYLTSIQWQRLGLARDRVFKLEWSVPTATALQGAFLEVDSSAKS